jgi:hypothetical protein
MDHSGSDDPPLSRRKSPQNPPGGDCPPGKNLPGPGNGKQRAGGIEETGVHLPPTGVEEHHQIVLSPAGMGKGLFRYDKKRRDDKMRNSGRIGQPLAEKMANPDGGVGPGAGRGGDKGDRFLLFPRHAKKGFESRNKNLGSSARAKNRQTDEKLILRKKGHVGHLGRGLHRKMNQGRTSFFP